MELEISTSPRSTWVWAPDDAAAAEVRSALDAARQSWYPAEGRNSERRVTDLDIGVVAMEALGALADAGYTFRWHPVEAPWHSEEQIYGVPVGPALTD
jgi:hypothetical protein